jgi:hypothetical protein
MLTFGFEFEERYRWMLALIGVKPSNSEVVIDGDEMRVRFGPWKLHTPLSNVVGFETSGPYKWYRAIGARGSFKDRGLTFGSTTTGGICVKFAEPISALVPGDVMPHPGMTVTVTDVEGLAAALRERGVDG